MQIETVEEEQLMMGEAEEEKKAGGSGKKRRLDYSKSVDFQGSREVPH